VAPFMATRSGTAPVGLSSSGRRKKPQLAFPPLTKGWTVKSEASWPGAEYTRRSRLKTKCDEPYGAAFLEELQKTLGASYSTFEQAMEPTMHPKLDRGRPPSTSGNVPIAAAYTLPRAEGVAGPATGDIRSSSGLLTAGVSLASTTQSLSGMTSSSRFLETVRTPYGACPAYMFEDREKMGSLNEWFVKYGRPAPMTINLGPRQMYSHSEPSHKRCCGEPSQVSIMKKGYLTN